jgi:ribosomal protein S18 acetylase RimI-like enzyme
VSEAELEVRLLTPAEQPQLRELLVRRWGSPEIVSRGRVHDASAGPAIACFADDRLVGLATYRIHDEQCELLTLNAFERRRGIGSRLLAAVAARAQSAGCRRLWLITTNDNLTAIRFYERRGLKLVAVHHDAVDAARKLKPQIPEFAENGIRISDELEFELDLNT